MSGGLIDEGVRFMSRDWRCRRMAFTLRCEVAEEFVRLASSGQIDAKEAGRLTKLTMKRRYRGVWWLIIGVFVEVAIKLLVLWWENRKPTGAT